MRRDQLEHILRAASTIAGDPDVTFFDDYDNEKSDMVDMHIGEDSHFHATFGYYAQGVNVEVATLPAGWQDRLVTYTGKGANGAKAHCLEPHDLVVAKLVAHRMKDMEFTGALLAAGLVNADVLLERAKGLEAPAHVRMVIGWVVGWITKHGTTQEDTQGNAPDLSES